MRYLSVCSGIEAASAAWGQLGWKAVAFSEIDKFPSAVLAHHYPDVPNLGDMTKFKEWPLEPGSVDVLVGGSPCQSFSLAGLRGGLDDDRGNLALVYCRILEHLRPRWFVFENVPGVLSSFSDEEKGSEEAQDAASAETEEVWQSSDFAAILMGFQECGYSVAARILDSQYFGVPQRRRRIFVVGHLGNWRCSTAALFEPESLRGDTKKGSRKGKTVAGTLGARSGRSVGAQDAEAGHLVAATLSKGFGDRGVDMDQIANGNETGGVPFILDQYNFTVSDICSAVTTGTGTAMHNVLATETVPALTCSPYADRGDVDEKLIVSTSTGDVAHCLNAGGMGRQDYETETMVVSFQPRIGRTGRGYEENMVGTLTGAVAGDTSDMRPCVAGKNIGVRRLTAVECERLQGFPDNFTAIPYRGKPADQCPDGPRYSAIGNSMAVPVMAWIGRRIQKVEEVLKSIQQQR
jgi:DNA (cytosine-5)-methyltransferase 1